MDKRARILIFTGDGKGKTTAAMGMALRGVGHDMNIYITQFAKESATGEKTAFEKFPNVTFVQTGKGFVPDQASDEFEEHRQAAQVGLKLADEAISSGKYDLVIMDEACFAVSKNLIDEDALIEVINKAKPNSRLVLTGRDATPGLIDIADTVSNIKYIKHGYEKGIEAQKGVEY